MNIQSTSHNRSAVRGFISTQAAIVLAVITGAMVALAFEWHSAHSAHSAKGHHHSSAVSHH